MGHEYVHEHQPAPRKSYEVFGLTEKEVLDWRISQDRFKDILSDKQSIIHKIESSSNNFGEFMFVTTSRPGEQGRIFITFYSLGYHKYRERWLTKEWFWYQTASNPDLQNQKVNLDEATKILNMRLEQIEPETLEDTQTARGYLFELLADLKDEDWALDKLQDLESKGILFSKMNADEEKRINHQASRNTESEGSPKNPLPFSSEENIM